MEVLGLTTINILVSDLEERNYTSRQFRWVSIKEIILVVWNLIREQQALAEQFYSISS